MPHALLLRATRQVIQAMAAILATASLAFADIRTVTNLDDSGPGSLRATIAEAAAGDIIDFAVTGTITLTSASLVIDKPLTISGPGADRLTVERSAGISNNFFPFRIFKVTRDVEAAISGLTIQRGRRGSNCVTDALSPALGEISSDSACSGGGIWNGGTLTVANCVFVENVGIKYGGAIGNAGQLTVLNSTFTGNRADNTGEVRNIFGGGGAIFNTRFGTAEIVHSTFERNVALFSGDPAVTFLGTPPTLIFTGGAIHNRGALRAANNTFYQNRAQSGGGAVWNENFDGDAYFDASLTITGSTFHQDTIDGGFGVEILNMGFPNHDAGRTATMRIANSIFDSGTGCPNPLLANGPIIGGENPHADFISEGFNLSCDEGSGLLDATGDRILANARLDPAGPLDNGGPTRTIRLLNYSDAIDQGSSPVRPLDQRYQSRGFDFPGVASAPQGDGSDIGAYEVIERPPVARCAPVTVTAGPSCTAEASIDAGSADPDPGDILTVLQSPAGPFTLGVTAAILTASDDYGATSQCPAPVTIVDRTAPLVSSSVVVPALSPTVNHGLVHVGLTAVATDNCTVPGTFQVRVFADEDDQAPTDRKTVFSPDAADLAIDSLKLRAERADEGDGRVYLVIVSATDPSGNTGFSCNSVVVPHNLSAASLTSVGNQAAAALQYCAAHGSAPAGFFLTGDGPVIGPKQ